MATNSNNKTRNISTRKPLFRAQILNDDPRCNIIGWSNNGTVTWMYWTFKDKLVMVRMAPLVARRLAKECLKLDTHIRENLNDCSYSAAQCGKVETDFYERCEINPPENPGVQTLGISLAWEHLNGLSKSPAKNFADVATKWPVQEYSGTR